MNVDKITMNADKESISVDIATKCRQIINLCLQINKNVDKPVNDSFFVQKFECE